MSVSMFTDGWICEGSAIGSFTDGWVCYPASDLIIVPPTDPTVPVHISLLATGMQVRVSLRGGYHMTPKKTKRGNFLVIDRKPGNSRGFDKGVLLGSIVVNSPAHGEMSMDVYDLASRTLYRAAVPYKNMAIIQRVIPITTIVETATRSGGVANGTKLVGGQLSNPRVKLVKVKL